LDIASRAGKLEQAGLLLDEILTKNDDSQTKAQFAKVKLQLAKGEEEAGLKTFDQLLAKDNIDEDLRSSLLALRFRLSVVNSERYPLQFPKDGSMKKMGCNSLAKLVRVAVAQGKLAELQEFAVTLLRKRLAKNERYDHEMHEPLLVLMRVAMEQGDIDDALLYTKQAPYWSSSYFTDDAHGDLLTSAQKVALIERVHGGEKALAYLTYDMSRNPGEDTIYAELVQRLGDAAIPLFAEQSLRTPFEEPAPDLDRAAAPQRRSHCSGHRFLQPGHRH
jgi:tetratricopeptide (TPR) repeat protein